MIRVISSASSKVSARGTPRPLWVCPVQRCERSPYHSHHGQQILRESFLRTKRMKNVSLATPNALPSIKIVRRLFVAETPGANVKAFQRAVVGCGPVLPDQQGQARHICGGSSWLPGSRSRRREGEGETTSYNSQYRARGRVIREPTLKRYVRTPYPNKVNSAYPDINLDMA